MNYEEKTERSANWLLGFAFCINKLERVPKDVLPDYLRVRFSEACQTAEEIVSGAAYDAFCVAEMNEVIKQLIKGKEF